MLKIFHKPERPLVSVVVPCYNQAPYLRDTLDSVKKQTYGNWECIVVDDGSTDESSKIVAEYVSADTRFKLIQKENGGLSHARNYGIRAAEGKFILPLDGDDVILPKYIELAVKRFTSHPETKLVYCEACFFGNLNQDWPLPEYDWEKLLFANMIFCSCIYRKEDFEKTEGYCEEMKHGFEDWAFLISLLKKDDIVYRIPKKLFKYRIKSESMTATLTHPNKELALRQLIKFNREVYIGYLLDKMPIMHV